MKYLIILLPLFLLISLPNTSHAKKGDKDNPSVSSKGSGPSNSAYEHANEKARFKRNGVGDNEDLNKEQINKKKSKNKKDDENSEGPDEETIHHNKERERERDGKNDKNLIGDEEKENDQGDYKREKNTDKEKGHGKDHKGRKNQD